MNDDMKAFERRSRAAFDESVASQDAATRAKLAGSRAKALAGLRDRRLPWASPWVPAGAPAAAALVAVMFWLREETREPAPDTMTAAFEELDMVASGEDFDMLDEEPGFYAWAAAQMADDVG